METELTLPFSRLDRHLGVAQNRLPLPAALKLESLTPQMLPA